MSTNQNCTINSLYCLIVNYKWLWPYFAVWFSIVIVMGLKTLKVCKACSGGYDVFTKWVFVSDLRLVDSWLLTQWFRCPTQSLKEDPAPFVAERILSMLLFVGRIPFVLLRGFFLPFHALSTKNWFNIKTFSTWASHQEFASEVYDINGHGYHPEKELFTKEWRAE